MIGAQLLVAFITWFLFMRHYSAEAKKEIDFLIQKDGKVIPIEVKSGNTRATSLNSVIKNKSDIDFGYKFIDGNIGVGDAGIITLPLYMALFI